MNIDISKIVENKIKQLDDDKIIEKQIEDSIETTILKAVKGSLEDYSFKRDIEKQITNSISEITANIGFDAYNSFIAETIRKSVIEAGKEDIKNKIAQSFDSIFCKRKETIKLSEIFKEYEELYSDAEYDTRERAEDGYTFSRLEEDEDDDKLFKHVSIIWALEQQKSYSRYSSSGSDDYRLIMNLMQYKDGGYTISNLEWEGKDLTKNDSLYHMSNFEALLASLYFNKTKVEIDLDEDAMEIGLSDY